MKSTFALLCGVLLAFTAQAADRPNIVLIIADDLGCGDLGSYGGRAIPTPHLDRLAREGLRFTHAYAPSATCTPSRYALFTGEYAWRQPPKKTSILDGDAPLALDPARPTLASFLRAQGYATSLVGKWHLGLGDGVTPVDFNARIAPGPLEIGFDEAFFIPATVDRVPCVFIDGHRVAGLDSADPIGAGATSDRIFSLLDLFASTAGLLVRPLPAGAGTDGLDLSALLLGRTPTRMRTELVQHGIGNVLALRSGDWKYIPANADTTSGIGRGADPKDTRFSAALVTEPLLFNLAKDPGETKNLALTEPARVAALAARLEAIRAATP